MKTKQQIRKELTEIKYYHTHREVFESHSSEVESEIVTERIPRYNRLMMDAPMKLLHIYYAYYMTEYSQEEVADQCYISVSCVSKLCQQLCKYLSERSEDCA